MGLLVTSHIRKLSHSPIGNITTDTTGAITQILDYYPYGDTRIDTGTDNETKQYTGYTNDASTGLHYAGARYYAGNIGRFISQDPANLRLGTNPQELQQLLLDPQQLNTYTYTRNNPVNHTDPNGEILPALLVAGELIALAFAFCLEFNKKISNKLINLLEKLLFKKDPLSRNRAERLFTVFKSFLMLFGLGLILVFWAGLRNSQ